MTTPCPDSQDLVHLARGEPERRALLAHLEACADCRAEAAAASHALKSAAMPATRRWMLPAAAAAILLVAFLARSSPPASSSSPQGRNPPAAASSPFSVALQADGDRTLDLGRSALLTLRAGARADVKAGEVLWLDGDLALETRGDPVLLRIPGAEILAEDADLVLQAPASPALGWIRNAYAAEAGPRLIILRGKALLRRDGLETSLSEGQETLPAWRPGSGWNKVPGLPDRIRDGSKGYGGTLQGGDFAWEALIKRSVETALFEMVWTSEGRGWHLPLGQGAMGPAGTWVRVRLERCEGWVRLTAGGRELLAAPEADLGRRAYSCEPLAGAPGIRAWGGDVEVLEARWRALP